MADDDVPDGRLQRLISWGASVVAPLSVLTAVLFYFGYASSKAQYEYFGVDVDTIGLSTQDYVMRSPQVLLTPLFALVLLGVAFAATHDVVRRRVEDAVRAAGDDDPDVAARGTVRLTTLYRRFRVLRMAGLALVGAAALLLLGYAALQAWPLYPLVTPLVMGIGAALAAYAGRILATMRPRERPRTGVVLALVLVLTADVFWATATLAEWSGRGLAHRIAAHLDDLPTVVVDTRERLEAVSPKVDERALPASAGQTFRYRYRGLHLLIQGKDRIFLVPGQWSPSNFTLMLPTDGSVRLQFQFENSPP
jgi:hypothetical protein